MIEKEYALLEERLGSVRGKDSRFFAFANTVAAKSAERGITEGHGWIGIRFQLKPLGPVNDIVMHVKVKDARNILQQETLGIVGTNLIYSAFNHHKNPQEFILSLMDNLDRRRIDINFVRFTGKDFEKFDNHILNLSLVQNNFTDAVTFDSQGHIVEPGDLFYGKHVVILRGRFRPITKVHMDIIESGLDHAIKTHKDFNKKNVLVIAELTLNNLLTSEKMDMSDFLSRVETLAAMGIPVMISNFAQFYQLKVYFNQIKHNDLQILMGANILKDLFNEKYYDKLQGGILEGLGDIFKSNCRILVYPFKEKDKLVTAHSYEPPSNLKYIYKHLITNNMIQDIPAKDKKCLDINTQEILGEIKKKDKSWESKVPETVLQIIKKKKLFGYS
jgi:nicotinic acid mononucleotide adenylyltransferase